MTFFVFACLLMCFCLCARDGEQRERIESGDGERKEKNGEKREKRREKKKRRERKKKSGEKKKLAQGPTPAPYFPPFPSLPPPSHLKGSEREATRHSGKSEFCKRRAFAPRSPGSAGAPLPRSGRALPGTKKKKKSLSERLSLSFLSSSLSRLSLSLFSKKERHLLYFFEILLQIKSRFSGRKCFATDFFFLAVLRLSKRKKKLVVFKMARS